MGPNGKVNNMIKPFQASRYDLILISDSSIKGTSCFFYLFIFYLLFFFLLKLKLYDAVKNTYLIMKHYVFSVLNVRLTACLSILVTITFNSLYFLTLLQIRFIFKFYSSDY